MSYAVTDAVEDDMRKELAVVRRLNDDIDQLASEARGCNDVAPLVETLLGLAWWFAEEAMREQGGGSCGHQESRPVAGQPFCLCCEHYRAMKPMAERVRRAL